MLTYHKGRKHMKIQEELRCRICRRVFEDSGEYLREASGETVCRARRSCILGSGSKERLIHRKPHWLGSVNEFILPQLNDLKVDYVDRQTIQLIFGVSRSEAHRILRNPDTLELSGRLLVRKDTLIQWIHAFFQSDAAQCEIRRVERIDEMLKTIRRNAAGSRIRVPAAADVRSRLLRDLPGGIELHPGELRGSFFGAEDLAAKLFELSQAMANDWRNFEAAVEDKL